MWPRTSCTNAATQSAHLSRERVAFIFEFANKVLRVYRRAPRRSAHFVFVTHVHKHTHTHPETPRHSKYILNTCRGVSVYLWANQTQNDLTFCHPIWDWERARVRTKKRAPRHLTVSLFRFIIIVTGNVVAQEKPFRCGWAGMMPLSNVSHFLHISSDARDISLAMGSWNDFNITYIWHIRRRINLCKWKTHTLHACGSWLDTSARASLYDLRTYSSETTSWFFFFFYKSAHTRESWQRHPLQRVAQFDGIVYFLFLSLPLVLLSSLADEKKNKCAMCIYLFDALLTCSVCVAKGVLNLSTKVASRSSALKQQSRRHTSLKLCALSAKWNPFRHPSPPPISHLIPTHSTCVIV